MRRNICVYTEWPELLIDSTQSWTIKFCSGLKSIINNTVDGQLYDFKTVSRHVCRAHDRNYDLDFEYVLYMYLPTSLDLADLAVEINNTCTTYYDHDHKFILYRRLPTWQETTVKVEKRPNPVGVIFIDCWEIIKQSTWKYVDKDFNFYQHLNKILKTYNITNCVFHTNQFGSHALAKDLELWIDRAGAIDIMEINNFKNYYQNLNLKNWIVVGAHWQICTHDRDLGFYNLLELKRQDPELRIYSLMSGTIKFVDPENNNIDNPVVTITTAADYEDDSLNWHHNGKLPELLL